MTFDALEANVAVMKEYIGIADADLTDDELKALHYDAAKRELEHDLRYSLNISPSDTDKLDYIADTYTERIQSALMYKQLQLYYFKHNQGYETGAYVWMDEFKQSYEHLRSTFKGMKVSETNVGVTTSRVLRG